MTPEDAEEWTQAQGQSLAGQWRLIALAVKLGVPKALNLSTEQWVQRLGGYVKLPVQKRKEAVKELQSDGMSTRQIAGVLGVHHATVERDSGANAPPLPDGGSEGGANAPPVLQKARVPRPITQVAKQIGNMGKAIQAIRQIPVDELERQEIAELILELGPKDHLIGFAYYGMPKSHATRIRFAKIIADNQQTRRLETDVAVDDILDSVLGQHVAELTEAKLDLHLQIIRKQLGNGP